MSHLSFQIRRRRRLPHVQRATRSRPSGTFWLTFNTAVNWLRRNHGVLDKTLVLLEIYPTLIQDMSLDALWDFMAPFFTRAGVGDKSGLAAAGPSGGRCWSSHSQPAAHSCACDRREGCSSTISRPSSHVGPTAASAATRPASTVGSRSGSARVPHPKGSTPTGEPLQVPIISITYASDDHEPELQALSPGPVLGEGDSLGGRIPRVYLCCLCQHSASRAEEKLHRHVLHALQHDFYVRSGPCADEEPGGSAVYYGEDLSEADLCVFLLDDLSLNAPTCFKSLCAACALGTPTVFLKDSKYSLPVPLPDFILQHNLGLESPELSRASTLIRPPRGGCVTPEPHHHRTKRRPPAAEIRSSSASPSFREEENRGTQPLGKAKQGLQDSDVVLCLLNGYRNALVFQEDRHQECEKELREAVHTRLGTGPCDTISANGRSTTPATKSSSFNTLHPTVRKSELSRRGQRVSLEIPRLQPYELLQQESSSSSLSDYMREEEHDFPLPATPNELTIDIPFAESSGNTSPSPGNFLSPHPCFHRNGHPSFSSSPSSPPSSSTSSHLSSSHSLHSSPLLPDRSPSASSTSSLHSSLLSATPSGSRSSSSRSFVHLHQFQQQLQQDRAMFLSSVSPVSSDLQDVTLNGFQERQTVYLVCDKPKKEPPRLVKFPPSSPTEEPELGGVEVADTFSEASDSPVSFRNVDLSSLVNGKPALRGSDTPDSDASSLF